jgi:uncharacterized membrane protein YkvA (DUF1232 family)
MSLDAGARRWATGGPVGKHTAEFKQWVDSVREDAAALERVVASDQADKEARRLAAAGLSYLVMRMDLVPDWEPAVGVLDDVFVLRVCARLAASHGEDGLDDKAQVGLERLANQAERIEEFLGADLHARFKAYCGKLVDQTVRGRTAEAVVSDPAARQALFAEVDDDIGRMPVASFADAEAIAVKLKAYLEHKLK